MVMNACMLKWILKKLNAKHIALNLRVTCEAVKISNSREPTGT
jgi:hypothetical protein